MSERSAENDAPRVPMCLWMHPGIHRVSGVRRCRRFRCAGCTYRPLWRLRFRPRLRPTPPAKTGGDR